MGLNILNLNKSYQFKSEKLTIIDQLNVQIKTAEVIAILGSSGSGKSTLLSLISGLDRADSGEIQINETDICKLDSKQMIRFRAQNIGIVFQQFHLVPHLNAFENVTLPLQILEKKVDSAKVEKVLDQVGLAHRMRHLPSELSGGESQRLAIARALIAEPALLLADEPSGNLDTETGEKVMSTFFNQVRSQKTTTILVTHDQRIAEHCDRKLFLRKGQLWAE
jgi:putative ABC transport system ATP-binding protein